LAALRYGIAVADSRRAVLTIAAVVNDPPLWVGLTPFGVPWTPESLRDDAERREDAASEPAPQATAAAGSDDDQVVAVAVGQSELGERVEFVDAHRPRLCPLRCPQPAQTALSSQRTTES
jgi:hypothetical protein